MATTGSAKSGYHHGDLRRTILDAAAEAIAESGPGGWSLRELARRAGVSHAAPAYHFGDKPGLLTALAVEGFDRLSVSLIAAGEDFLEIGVAYVDFAVQNPAHFEVMFSPELYRRDDPDVLAARGHTQTVLEQGLTLLPQRPASPVAGIAAWSIAHGFADLWLNGALPADLGDDPVTAARPVLKLLFDR